MSKSLRLIFVCFLLHFLLVSCSENSVLGQTKSTKETAISNKQILTNTTPQISQSDGYEKRRESIVYSIVLETVFVYSSDEKYNEIRDSGIIGFRKISIKPTGFEEFSDKNPFNLPKETFDNFESINQSKLKLRDKYDVKDAMAAVPGEGNPKEVLKNAKTQKIKGMLREKIGVLIGLSRVGFSRDGTQALLYAEYTTANKNKKMYIFVPLEITENSVSAKREEIKIEFLPE